ncbi:MAG: uracil-DNA glycosylase [Treponema sp.]|nr:uracil-DNA glycosylase [Treponema sp.]
MLNDDMTSADKEKIAGFLHVAGDFLGSGYISEKIDYQFDDIPPTVDGKTVSVKDDSLEQIADEIRGCKNCPLGETRKNAVPGEGAANPLVLVIGEGPGAEEDAQGRPFVGNAGKLLDKMLSSIDLSRTTNCFIANVVKCRPPGNRDPHPQESASCANFLQRQISFLKPKFILLVGNVAAQNVLKTTDRVGKLRGKFTEYKIDGAVIPLLVTYHPSALLHSDEYKRPAWEDLKLLRSKIEESGG